MLCYNCGTFEPIEYQRIVYIRPACAELISLFCTNGFAAEEIQESCILKYKDREEMLSVLQLLQGLNPSIRQKLKFCVTGGIAPCTQHRWMPLSDFEEFIEQCDVATIILEKQFTSYMQPIVDDAESIVAYEFLLRSRKSGIPFQPNRLFEIARTAGLHSFLDRAARISAIETSALWLPKGVKRFVNFLPSSVYEPEFCLSHTFRTIERLALEPTDFVFEVVETERVDDMQHLQSIFEVYRQNGISVAMDDVGAGYSTLEQMVRLKPDYVKIDRSLIDRCDEKRAHQRQLALITNLAHSFGAKVLAEGIERREEYEFCRGIGMEMAQGYLFGKPAQRPPLDYDGLKSVERGGLD
ncbi:EAL domain-containing protein [Paenibacillus dakarensis]|uniref:EAL domain-containing protein n=1 Tax=Paenibacillus dakarensis TaxID=1527293 RepID=UPI0006D5ADE4|nr:EAL domain-containing protein [Paenibacillus dakarensis]